MSELAGATRLGDEHRAWRRLAMPLAVTLLVQISQNLALLSVVVLAPLIAPALDVPVAWSGFFVGLAYLMGAVTSSQTRLLLQPVGPMTASLGALAVSVAGLVAAATAELWLMLPSALCLGFAHGVTTPTSSEILVARAPPALFGRVFSIKQTAVPGGGLLAGIIAPPLAASLGWRPALLVVALAVAMVVLLLLPLRRSLDAARSHRRAAPSAPIALILSRPALRRIALAGFCLAGAQLSVSTFFTAYLVEAMGMTLVVAGLLFGVLQAMGVPARVLWGWLADRLFGLRWALAILALLSGLGLAILALARPDWPVLAIALLAVYLGLSVMAWTGLLIAAAVATLPEEASAVSGGAMAFTFAGVVVVPPLIGLVVAGPGGYEGGFGLAALFAFVAVALLTTRPRS